MFCVVTNTIILALDGIVETKSSTFFSNLNLIFTIIFGKFYLSILFKAVEMFFKMLAFGIIGYFRDKMNCFDALIVALSFVEIILGGSNSAFSAFRSVRIFRAFRVLRVTKLIRSLKFMKIIIQVISKTIDSFMYIAILLILFIFIYT